MLLSKTDYILGMECEKALWLIKHHPELVPDIDVMLQRRFDIGYEVQELAHKLFPSGMLISDGDLQYLAHKTKKASETNNILFEATAVLSDKAFCRIDVLERNRDAWNLIEIKSSANVLDNHIDDLAFQKYVFENAGYKINKTKIIYLNKYYVRKGALDIRELFITEDISLLVDELYPDVAYNIDVLRQLVEQDEEPEVMQHKTKPCKECCFKTYCRRNLPDYPAFYLFYQDRRWQKFFATHHTYKVEDIPNDYKLGNMALIDREAYFTKQIHVESQKINEWLGELVYPLYYLDYETAQLAIPLFDDSHPYQQIPFQFSLHIQENKGGELKHIGFLHKNCSDPRRAIAECLVNNCGTKGSIIVYHKDFEQGRNKELAAIFPDLSTQLLTINERIVDLEDVFKNRWLYSPKQKSSASIKYVLPAFCDLSYQGMEIANGGEAMSEYESFFKGKQIQQETEKMFEALGKYCEQDTLAMVKLIEVLYQYAEK